MSIGGDWYDAFLQPDGDTVLVIGDVMGHDIEAAAAMGQVKTLVRGIAYDRLEEPADVLRRVDHALVGLAVPTLATALVCRVEQDEADRAAGLRRLRWSSAGHPAPMLLGPTARSWTSPPPSGRRSASAGSAPGSTAGVDARGSTLLLFTDGLFERRGVPWTRAARRCGDRGAVPAAAGRCSATGCSTQLLGDGVEDDVAVLAVRAHPVDAARRRRPGPSSCRPPCRTRADRQMPQARVMAKAARKPTW